MSEDVLNNICEHYGIEDVCIGSFFDTSHGEEDIRYSYVISQKYVLKMNTAEMVTEDFLQGINQLVEKYRDIGVWCPKILANKEEKLLYQLEQDGRLYHCYVEEYAPYEIAKGKVDSEYALKEEMLAHVGKLAAKYSGKDLRKTYSMWSIIDLAPLDVEVDEKQENMNALVEALQKHGYDAEAEEVVRVNITCRDHIMKYFDLLPRCVYQGDLNRSNILIDKNKHFTGIIDFNMYGTEVNVNCFLNESMYYLDEQDFETMTATELFERMNEVQKKLLIPIFKYYILNEVEKKVYRDYKKIIDLCFYPNVMLWIYLIENHKYEDKVIQLIRFLARDKGQIES